MDRPVRTRKLVQKGYEFEVLSKVATHDPDNSTLSDWTQQTARRTSGGRRTDGPSSSSRPSRPHIKSEPDTTSQGLPRARLGPKPRRKPGPKPGSKRRAKPGPKPGSKRRAKPGPKPGSKQRAKPAPKPGSTRRAKPGPKPGSRRKQPEAEASQAVPPSPVKKRGPGRPPRRPPAEDRGPDDRPPRRRQQASAPSRQQGKSARELRAEQRAKRALEESEAQENDEPATPPPKRQRRSTAGRSGGPINLSGGVGQHRSEQENQAEQQNRNEHQNPSEQPRQADRPRPDWWLVDRESDDRATRELKRAFRAMWAGEAAENQDSNAGAVRETPNGHSDASQVRGDVNGDSNGVGADPLKAAANGGNGADIAVGNSATPAFLRAVQRHLGLTVDYVAGTGAGSVVEAARNDVPVSFGEDVKGSVNGHANCVNGVYDLDPYYSSELLDSLLPDPRLRRFEWVEQDRLWDQERESQLEKQHGPWAKKMARLGEKNDAEMWMWRLMIYFFDCMPHALFRYGLRIDTSAYTPLPQYMRTVVGKNRNPSYGFCLELAMLMCHPVWEGDLRKLRFALQIAVWSRIKSHVYPVAGLDQNCFTKDNDLRNWMGLLKHYADLNNTGDEGWLQVTADFHYQSYAAGGVHTDRDIKQLKDTLERVYRNKQQHAATEQERVLFLLKESDIVRVRNALDSQISHGQKKWKLTAEYCRIFATTNPRALDEGSDGVGAGQTREMRMRSGLAEMVSNERLIGWKRLCFLAEKRERQIREAGRLKGMDDSLLDIPAFDEIPFHYASRRLREEERMSMNGSVYPPDEEPLPERVVIRHAPVVNGNSR